jgi:hypothetical protein
VINWPMVLARAGVGAIASAVMVSRLTVTRVRAERAEVARPAQIFLSADGLGLARRWIVRRRGKAFGHEYVQLSPLHDDAGTLGQRVAQLVVLSHKRRGDRQLTLVNGALRHGVQAPPTSKQTGRLIRQVRLLSNCWRATRTGADTAVCGSRGFDPYRVGTARMSHAGYRYEKTPA